MKYLLPLTGTSDELIDKARIIADEYEIDYESLILHLISFWGKKKLPDANNDRFTIDIQNNRLVITHKQFFYSILDYKYKFIICIN